MFDALYPACTNKSNTHAVYLVRREMQLGYSNTSNIYLWAQHPNMWKWKEGLTRVLVGSSSLRTPGCHPSLLEVLPKTHHNQITRNTQQGNTISPPVASTHFSRDSSWDRSPPHCCTACNRSWAELSYCCHPHSYFSLTITCLNPFHNGNQWLTDSKWTERDTVL